MLINDKMPTIFVGIFTFYEQDKVRAQLSWPWKKFYNLGAWSWGYTAFCMLNSAEHETYPAYKC